MAIEVNKRKRKYQNSTEGADDGDIEVPKKIAKKQKKTPEKPKQSKAALELSNDQYEAEETAAWEQEAGALQPDVDADVEPVGANGEHDSGFEEKPIKFSKDFKMLHFRNKLRGSNFITELRHFLHVVQVRPKMVAKYIEKRGKPFELAEALERVNKSNVLHVAYLCQALQLVLIEILSNQKELMESAVSACRYFLKLHGAVLDVLLKSAQLQHRRIALKLLTAIVCVDPQLGRQLLASYDILSNVKTIENLLSHSKFELHEEETVRKCFIHFVLAYLVDGNTLLIRNILDRDALIRALASGLLYDDHVTVCVVLSTLRQYVLECTDISKTKKIHVFDLECCRHLVRLYDWCGPNVYAAKFGGKGGAQVNLQPQQIDALVDAQGREAVANALHDFLLVLLTSRKYGITFDAVTYFRQRHNAIQGKLIGFLYKPWCSERKTDLVVKILTACPDLARHTVRNFAGIVNPMRTPQRDLVAAINFLTQIISTLHPKLLRSAFDKITLTDCAYWVKDICLPIETLLIVNGSKMLRNKNFQIRLATNRLLLIMFTQYSHYMIAIKQREQARGNVNSLRRFKFDILNHILVSFPTIEDVLFSLYMSIQAQDAADVAVLDHLDATLDLVLVICRENRSFVNKTSTILDYLEILRPLYANDDALAPTNVNDIKLELKAIKTILLLFPKALKPTEKLFNSVLKSFIKAFVHGTIDVQREAGELLRRIFINTGLFDSGVLEIDLWLEALRFCSAETVNVVTQVLIEVLQVTRAEVDAPKSEAIVNERKLHKLFETIEAGLSVQAYVETLSISKLMPLIFKGVDIVPPLDKYLETVCLLLFHYFPVPEEVVALYKMQFSALNEYMVSWLATSSAELQLDDGAVNNIPWLKQLQAALLKGEHQFEVIFGKISAEEPSFEFTPNGSACVKLSAVLRNDRLILIYAQQALFVVAQLVEKQNLQRLQAEAAAAFLINCMALLRTLEVDNASDDVDSTEVLSCAEELLKYIYSVRVTHVRDAELFSAPNESHLNYLIFLRMLTESCNASEHFHTYAANYRQKIVKAVAISVRNAEETKMQSEKLSVCVKLVQSFQLHVDECLEVLELLGSQLKYSDFFTATDGGNTSQKSIYYDLLVCVLQRLGTLQKAVQCDGFIRKFVKLYTNFIKHLGSEANLEQLDEALHEFLLVSHQYISQLGSKFFGCMFAERRLAKPTIRLACLLLERNDKLQEEFAKLLPANINKKELVYPLLAVAFQRKMPLDSGLLQNIYQTYKNGFMKTIEKPQKAGVIYKEHANCSISLIEQCMPRSECVDFCNKNFKLDAVEVYQVRIVHAIYSKAVTTLEATATKQKSTIFVNFINLQIQMLSMDLKKQVLDLDKVELFAFLLFDWWRLSCKSATERVQTEDGPAFDPDFNKITKSQQWINFCKLCLKFCMQANDPEVEKHSHTDALYGLLLKLLSYLCDQLYSDSVETEQPPPEPAQLFEMVCTHSKFYEIVLSHRSSQVKTEVLHLLHTLARKNPAGLNEEQIPILLGAYQATLSAADRYALALLQLYERHDCGLQRYRPFIWGESAVAFYALRAADEERAKLTQQETSIAQVMSLVDRQICEYTIDNFPIWRKLNAAEQMPAVEFRDPNLKLFNFGTNQLERRIELGATAFDEHELRLCPKREGVYEQCYDPAFLIPLMNMCFAPESYVHPARAVQNGLLSLVFAALSSQDRDMRLAAGCVQLRYRTHFESSKFFERPLWIQAYDNIQAGLSDLRESWMKHKKNSGTPRVPFISGLFVAKTFNLTTDPTHLLYKQLTMYLRLKSSFNFQCVPEFNVLFYSAEIEHQAFRQFIVEIIRNGIKSSTDLFLLVSTNTFKVLMGFYGSTMSTLDMNLQILSVFSTCVKIPASSKIMIEHVGILPWLSSVISTVEFHHFDVIDGLISIVSNLWYAVKANANEFHNLTHIFLEIHQLVLRILPHLSARIAPANFAKLLNVMQKTATSQHMAMSTAQLDNLIDCAQKHFSTLVRSIDSIKAFGGAGAQPHAEYCRMLQQQQVEPVAILALSSLRLYVIDWWQSHHDSTLARPLSDPTLLGLNV